MGYSDYISYDDLFEDLSLRDMAEILKVLIPKKPSLQTIRVWNGRKWKKIIRIN